jgi:hypothetical protein
MLFGVAAASSLSTAMVLGWGLSPARVCAAESADERSEKFNRKFCAAMVAAKRAAKTPTPEDAEPPRLEHTEADAGALPRAPAEEEPDLPAFAPTALPPIEAITATSDVRAFLARGVPEELTRAALRRAWVTDPTIRDFVGPAENQWDFTKPEDVPGFGSLELSPELRRIVASLFDAPERDPGWCEKAKQDEQLAKISPELSQATAALAPGGSKADGGAIQRSEPCPDIDGQPEGDAAQQQEGRSTATGCQRRGRT